MLNCTLLLDSAIRFGLKEGDYNDPRGAEMTLVSVSLSRF